MPEGGRRIGIVGAGAWGTALSWVARRAGNDVVLWAHRPETAETIRRRRANPDYLPGIALDAAVRATSDLAEVADLYERWAAAWWLPLDGDSRIRSWVASVLSRPTGDPTRTDG